MDRANGGGPGAAAATSRAERFENEKRRMIESCFNKKDVDGSRKSCYVVLEPALNSLSSKLDEPSMSRKLGDETTLRICQSN
jgi:hypothetical protein